jgi:hypothetical protein
MTDQQFTSTGHVVGTNGGAYFYRQGWLRWLAACPLWFTLFVGRVAYRLHRDGDA